MNTSLEAEFAREDDIYLITDDGLVFLREETSSGTIAASKPGQPTLAVLNGSELDTLVDTVTRDQFWTPRPDGSRTQPDGGEAFSSAAGQYTDQFADFAIRLTADSTGGAYEQIINGDLLTQSFVTLSDHATSSEAQMNGFNAWLPDTDIRPDMLLNGFFGFDMSVLGVGTSIAEATINIDRSGAYDDVELNAETGPRQTYSVVLPAGTTISAHSHVESFLASGEGWTQTNVPFQHASTFLFGNLAPYAMSALGGRVSDDFQFIDVVFTSNLDPANFTSSLYWFTTSGGFNEPVDTPQELTEAFANRRIAISPEQFRSYPIENLGSIPEQHTPGFSYRVRVPVADLTSPAGQDARLAFHLDSGSQNDTGAGVDGYFDGDVYEPPQIETAQRFYYSRYSNFLEIRPDAVLDSFHWTDDGGVEGEYTIRWVRPLPESLDLDIFWSADEKWDNSDLRASSTTFLTEREPGEGYPFEFEQADIDVDARKADRHLIAFIDSPPHAGAGYEGELGEYDESNNQTSLPVPDIRADTAKFVKDDPNTVEVEPPELVYTYKIDGTPLPHDATVSFLWSDSKSLTADPPPQTQPAFNDQLVQTEVGEYQPDGIPLAQLTTQPDWAKWLLVVFDKANNVREYDESNNIVGIPVAQDIVAESLVFNTIRGSGTEQPLRGVDARYTVRGEELTEPPKVRFYWSAKNVLVASQNEATVTRDRDFLLLTGGDNDREMVHSLPVEQDTYTFNEPARWDVAPVWAKYVIVQFDPDNEIDEADEDNNVTYVQIRNERELLNESVSAKLANGQAELIFSPGVNAPGGNAPLSEAEVVLGVEHFNWIQWVTAIPPTWQARTLFGVDDVVDLTVTPNQSVESALVIYEASKEKVEPQIALTTPFLDYIVSSNPTARRGFVVDVDDDGVADDAFQWVGTHDNFFYYLREVPLPGEKLAEALAKEGDNGGVADAYRYVFLDEPRQPVIDGQLPLDRSKDWYIKFWTTLVGVAYHDHTPESDQDQPTNSHVEWNGRGYNLTYEWKSDYVTSETGGVFAGAGGQNTSSAALGEFSAVEFSAGGVFDGRFLDAGVSAELTTGPVSHVIGRNPVNGQWWQARSDRSSLNNVPWATWDSAINWENVMPADVNGDGYDDMVGRHPGTGQWWVAVNDGAGGSTNQLWGTWSTAVTWIDTHVADVDGDGDHDIIGRNPVNGQWWVARSNGTDAFVNEMWAVWNPASNWQDIMVADVDGDHDDDILSRFPVTGDWYVARSNGTNAFTTTVWTRWNPDSTWEDIMTADADGDGNADILSRYPVTGDWYVALSNGTDSFTTSKWTTWNPSSLWEDIMTADVDGDGDSDILTRVPSSGDWYVAKSDGVSSFTTTAWARWNPVSTWDNIDTGDFDADGNDDIVARAPATGDWYVARSNGTNAFTTTQWGTWSLGVAWAEIGILDELLTI